MTVVAVRKYPDKIVFAADSIMTCGSKRDTPQGINNVHHPKLFERNGLVIGLTGTSAEGGLMLLFARNHKPLSPTIEGVMDFLLEFQEWARTKKPDFEIANHYLIGFEGEVFRTFNSLDVYMIHEHQAIGAGEDIANTALHLGKSPKEAVEIACELSVWCHPPISEITIPLS